MLKSLQEYYTNNNKPLYPNYMLPSLDSFGRRRIISPISYNPKKRMPTDIRKSTRMPNNYEKLYDIYNGKKIKLRRDDNLMMSGPSPVKREHLYSRYSRYNGKYIQANVHSEWDG